MISPQEIRKKSERKYPGFLESVAEGRTFSPMVIRGNKTYTKSSLPEFEKEIRSIFSESKGKKGYGYTIEYQRVKTKTLGVQDLPVSIYFETESDYLKFLGNEKEVHFFREDMALILAQFPELTDWIIRNPLKVVQHRGQWDNLLKVLRYFRDNPLPRMYIRELPIAVHTKFIERHKSILSELLDVLIPEAIDTESKEFEKRYHLKYNEPQIRFKVLDKSMARTCFSGIDDLAIPLSQFQSLELPVEKVLIVENKTTLYTTLSLPAMEDTIAIFGSGYGVFNLKNVRWLSRTELLYWGDIDVQGFEILAQFRSWFPDTKSIFMDRDTFDAFFEDDEGTPTNMGTPLHLTEAELELYERLKHNNWRLEQEKIPFVYVLTWFRKDGWI